MHAIGRDNSGRIDSFPSAVGEPDFAPGVSIRLSHENEMSNLVILTAQITGNDAGGNSGQSHQGRETGCVVFAKSKPAMKEELIEVILSVFAWRRRIEKSLGAKKFQSFLYDRWWLCFVCRPGLDQRVCRRADGIR